MYNDLAKVISISSFLNMDHFLCLETLNVSTFFVKYIVRYMIRYDMSPYHAVEHWNNILVLIILATSICCLYLS